MDNVNNICSDFLFSKSTFLTGMGSVMNLSGNYYNFNYSKGEREADEKAIKSDFAMIGKDISDSMSKFKSMIQSIVSSK
jgi:hypothetical protein